MKREHLVALVGAVGAGVFGGSGLALILVSASAPFGSVESIWMLLIGVVLLVAATVCSLIAFREIVRAYAGATNRKIDRSQAEVHKMRNHIDAVGAKFSTMWDATASANAETIKRLASAERRLLAAVESHGVGHGNTLSEFRKFAASAFAGVADQLQAGEAATVVTARQVEKRLGDLYRTQVGLSDRTQKWARRMTALLAERARTVEHILLSQTELLHGLARDPDSIQQVLDALESQQAEFEGARVDVLTHIRGLEDAALDQRTALEHSLTSAEERKEADRDAFDHLVAGIRGWIDSLGNDQRSTATMLKQHIEKIREEIANRHAESAYATETSHELVEAIDVPDLNSLERHLKAHADTVAIHTVRQVEALIQLLPLVETAEHSMPALGGWAMTPEGMLVVADIIRARAPRTIVELGSGTSTGWIAKLSAETNSRVVSIEHSPEYFAKTSDMLDEIKVERRPDLRLAELTPVSVMGAEYSWYDPTKIADVDEIDLLLVDGPPKAVGDKSRLPAVPMLIERLSDSGCIVFDDAHRPHEKATLAAWLERYPQLELIDSGSSRVAVLAKREVSK